MKKDSYASFGVPEYWIVDHKNQVIEQYVLVADGQPYELVNVFEVDDVVASEHIPCIAFIVKDGLKIK